MEIKQLEFFVKAAEIGSINQAAGELYTSQSNVSKVIGALESDIGFSLFNRNNKGVALTLQGEKIYEHAKNLLKNVDVLKKVAKESVMRKFSISTYPSHMISSVFVEFYKERNQKEVNYEFYEGTIEEISNNVSNRVSEIGIVYLSKRQVDHFKHIVGHKNIEFYPLETKEMCIYVGENSPLFNRDHIHYSELEMLSFVQPISDLFSLEHHLDTISVSGFFMDHYQRKICTNSDNLLIDLLINTEVSSFGIYYMDDEYDTYNIKPIRVKGCETSLVLGYLKRDEHVLSEDAVDFLKRVEISLERSNKK